MEESNSRAFRIECFCFLSSERLFFPRQHFDKSRISVSVSEPERSCLILSLPPPEPDPLHWLSNPVDLTVGPNRSPKTSHFNRLFGFWHNYDMVLPTNDLSYISLKKSHQLNTNAWPIRQNLCFPLLWEPDSCSLFHSQWSAWLVVSLHWFASVALKATLIMLVGSQQ